MTGAERLIPLADMATAGAELVDRGWAGSTDRVVLTLDAVAADDIRIAPVLPVRTVQVDDYREGQRRAAETLRASDVAGRAVDAAFALLNEGPHPAGGVMRGAVVMDHRTGDRLEPDRERGVRVSRVDVRTEDRARIDPSGRGGRIVDALILASKVAGFGFVVADLGWSDDPGYAPGYVASAAGGYVRFTRLKRPGSPVGGRVYFVDAATFDAARDVPRLEAEPTLVTVDSHSERIHR